MKKSFLLLFIFSATILANASQDDDALLFEQESEHAIIAQIKAFGQEHKWCLAAVAACLGFMYLQQTQEPQRSGSLAEAHAYIDELEGALKKYKFIYPFVKNMLEKKGIVVDV